MDKGKRNPIFVSGYKDSANSGHRQTCLSMPKYSLSSFFVPQKQARLDFADNLSCYRATQSVSLTARLKAHQCEYCGATDHLKMFDVRKLKNLEGKQERERFISQSSTIFPHLFPLRIFRSFIALSTSGCSFLSLANIVREKANFVHILLIL